MPLLSAVRSFRGKGGPSAPFRIRAAALVLGAALFFIFDAALNAYSVLSHEALLDTVWEPVIKPLLLRKFPSASEAQLLEAHAYAYGGCVIADMGYYPFGNRFFSDLAHYVRTGDFTKALLDEAQDMYEYAFALGALAHYAADNDGHPLGVNRSVPEIYPKLREKYGQAVTFVQDPKAHVLVEFSFDVAQIAGAGYLPATYHNFIGFKVARESLARAFQRTYGIEFKSLFFSEDLAIGTFRRGASEVIPRLTQIAWKERKDQIQKLNPGVTRKKFVYRLSRSNYDVEWGHNYKRTRHFFRRWGEGDAQLGLLARFLVFLLELLPKVGPLQTLNFRSPTVQTQAMFVDSFRATLDLYQGLLGEVTTNLLVLENKDLDTGELIRAGGYELADRTYGKLLHKLAENHFRTVTPELRNHIVAFYGDLNAPLATKKDPSEWQKTLRELKDLEGTPARATE